MIFDEHCTFQGADWAAQNGYFEMVQYLDERCNITFGRDCVRFATNTNPQFFQYILTG